MDRIEKTILRNLLHDEKYMRQVYPFLRPEYFSAADQKIFKLTADFIEKYNNCVIKDDIIYAFPYGESESFQTVLMFVVLIL